MFGGKRNDIEVEHPDSIACISEKVRVSTKQKNTLVDGWSR